MCLVKSNDVSIVNEVVNKIYVDEDDYDRLPKLIDYHDNFDQIGIAK